SGEPVCHLKAGTTRHEQCLPGRHSTSSNVAVISSSRQSTSQTMVHSNSPETMVPSGESMPDALPPVIVQPVAVPKAKVEPASDTSNEPSASSVPFAVSEPNGSKVMVKVSSSKSSNSIVISPALMASPMTSSFPLQPNAPRPRNC